MTRAAQKIQDQYDALMFARTPDAARKAARELVFLVLGETSEHLSLEEAVRETCRRLRPAADPREEQRFEDEMVELALGANRPHSAVAA
ncbi:MAG: hypothetical protein JO061_01895 [Acidobacteriaceae bacterium]|nr:hypothetical protein [Acidobacteriaceae bacterium]